MIPRSLVEETSHQECEYSTSQPSPPVVWKEMLMFVLSW